MSWWKQALWSLIILLAAGALWFHYFPGARQMAADWGLIQAPAAAATAPGEREGRAGRMAARVESPVITAPVTNATINDRRSEERRVGKACRDRGVAGEHRREAE